MAVAGQPGQAVARQGEHAVEVLGERTADDGLVVGVSDDRAKALSAEAGRRGRDAIDESWIHRAVRTESEDVAENIGGLEKCACRDDFAIGLHGEGIDAERSGVRNVPGKAQIHRAIGEEPGQRKNDAAVGAHASADEHFPTGHQGQ